MTYLHLIQCLLALSHIHIHAAAGARAAVPLTETFTAPTTCLSEILTLSSGYPSLEVGCRAVGTGSAGNECCPPNWTVSGYFSPGACPKDYQACTLPTTAQRIETTNLCCPSGFDCPMDVYFDLCYSFINTDVTVVYEVGESTHTAHASRVSATPIQIRFQASDSDVVPIPTESFDLPHEKTGRPLSRRVIWFIGVGASLGAICIGFVCICLFNRRKLRQQQEGDSGSQDTALLVLNSEAEEVPPPYQGRGNSHD